MKLFYTFTLILFLLMSRTIVSAQDSAGNVATLTLKECIETATAQNIDVKRSDYVSQGNEVNVMLAKGQFLPSANGAVYHGSNQGRNINPYTNTYINQSVNFANYSLDGSLTLSGD